MKKLKSIITLTIVAIIVIFNSMSVCATEKSIVKVAVKGEVEKGNNIEIVVDLSNLKNLYSALVDYTYDNTVIKVKEIVLNEEIKKQSVMPLFGELSLNGNRARYGFTFQGSDSMGLSGDYNFVTIKAEVLKDGELELSADKIKLQLVQKTENDMIDLPFMLSLPEKEAIEVKPTQSQVNSGQENNNLSTNNSDGNISGENQSDKNEQNVTGGKDDSDSEISVQDKDELLSEHENSDDINNEESILDKKENEETTKKEKNVIRSMITVIFIFISTIFIIHLYKKRK